MSRKAGFTYYQGDPWKTGTGADVKESAVVWQENRGDHRIQNEFSDNFLAGSQTRKICLFIPLPEFVQMDAQKTDLMWRQIYSKIMGP